MSDGRPVQGGIIAAREEASDPPQEDLPAPSRKDPRDSSRVDPRDMRPGAGSGGPSADGSRGEEPPDPPPDDAAPHEILEWAVRSFPADRLALVSAFGPGSLVMLELLSSIAPGLPVLFIDTLYHFPETLELVERVRRRYGLDLRVYRPAANRQEFEVLNGPRLWERDLERYQQLTKVEPFRRAVAGLDACITGRRRDQAPTRIELPALERGRPARVNPLAASSREDVWRFIREHELPYNPLHDHGYASIGDAPLTSPVLPGEPERAGRWRGLGRLECGIHTFHGS